MVTIDVERGRHGDMVRRGRGFRLGYFQNGLSRLLGRMMGIRDSGVLLLSRIREEMVERVGLSQDGWVRTGFVAHFFRCVVVVAVSLLTLIYKRQEASSQNALNNRDYGSEPIRRCSIIHVNPIMIYDDEHRVHIMSNRHGSARKTRRHRLLRYYTFYYPPRLYHTTSNIIQDRPKY